jgi:methylmalonyl-CoA mutase N-terminal domain/subunit
VIEDMGGAVEAIESGYYQREIQEASYAYQKAVDEGHKVIVGVNKFVEDGDERTAIFRPDPASERAQIKQLDKVREDRDGEAVEASLAKLEEVCRNENGVNLMEPIMNCVRAYASVGEICGTMRTVWGEYVPATAV